MEYHGKSSQPQIKMLIRAHQAIESIGLEPTWTEHGVTCRRVIMSHRPPMLLIHQFGAEPGRLTLHTTLDRPKFNRSQMEAARATLASCDRDDSHEISIDKTGRLTRMDVAELLLKDATIGTIAHHELQAQRDLVRTAEFLGLCKPR